MKSTIRNALGAGALFLLATAPAFGWGNLGHQTVGAIADQLIAGTPTETKVRALLKPGETLESISTWADCAKGYCGPLTAEMTQFVAKNRKHHDYHFTDLAFQATAYANGAVGTTDHDVVQTLKQCIAVLEGSASPTANPHGFSKREALLLLVHMTGDIHQPLHVGTAYIDLSDNFVIPATADAIDEASIFETQGDNFMQVGSVPLHSYWDGQAVNYAMRAARSQSPSTYAKYLIDKAVTVPQVPGAVQDWPAAWATESVVISNQAHAGIDIGTRTEVQDRHHGPHQVWQVELPPNYAKFASQTARSQLWAAGSRLASVLKTVMP